MNWNFDSGPSIDRSLNGFVMYVQSNQGKIWRTFVVIKFVYLFNCYIT